VNPHPTKRRTAAIIVAAGQGTRMGPNIEKLFLRVAGRPVVAHTWERFDAAACIDEIILVIREAMRNAFRELAVEYRFRKPHQLVIGGAERQDSVWQGLQALDPAVEWVAVHDGARPCVFEALIAETLQAAREVGAAVAAQQVTDTIKESEDGTLIARNLDRRRLWSVQTPQSFRVAVLRRALATARSQGLALTDDTAACELIGQPVKLVASAVPNPKVTMPGDLPYIEFLLKRMAMLLENKPAHPSPKKSPA
jgi:2-C-methyl-D-erythritol 4-phosphate cytidylyltransferase